MSGIIPWEEPDDIRKKILKTILEDLYIKELLQQKVRVLNYIVPQYLIDLKTSSVMVVDDKEADKFTNKIDLLIKERIEQIKKQIIK